ncbi:NAD(P)-dependent oxidoreductase [Streptomyces sp. NBC_00444]|uniref:NAD-dependent epimerase/dehydratase family protein n=1 Tax=Streptomyces sp. NBC_00444 TaxID=2975744 RepID=UPI002E20CDB5
MKIAVTGGSGFLGQATIRAAEAAGHGAWSFDRAHGNDILGDLGALAGADVVVHLAGMLGTSELFDAPESAVHANVIGTLRVLRWCQEHDAGYVGITMPPVFPSVYTATKVCADRLATAWHEAYGVPVAHVRAFNAYGPAQKWGPGHPQKILPTFARAAWEGRPLPVWGDGEQTMDLVHTDDVARMLVEATGHGDDVTFDAGTGVAVTVNELARAVLDFTGSNAGVEHLPMRKGETPTRIVAEGEGWDRLDWKPEHSWERVAEVVEWYRSPA